MVRRLRTKNLFGETPKQERSRIIRGRARAFTQGRTRAQVKRRGMFIGTTMAQRRARRRIIKRFKRVS